jgi:hypothetical protein
MTEANEDYYRYERVLIDVISNANPETLRDAVASIIRWSDDPIFNRRLHHLLIRQLEPWNELRKALVAIDTNGL